MTYNVFGGTLNIAQLNSGRAVIGVDLTGILGEGDAWRDLL